MTGSEQIKIGNVNFYSSDVKTSNVIYKNGEKINCVFLKNGTKLEFKDQKADSKASVKMGYDSGNDNKYGTGFIGIKGLSIEGTQSSDYYHLTNCDDYNINVENGGKDEVRIHDMSNKVNGTINADHNDKITFSNNDKFINMNEGFFIRKD